MAIKRQNNVLGQARYDVQHFRAVESAICADFDTLAGTMLAGDATLVVSGFNIVMSPTPVGGPASSILVNVEGGALFHPLATESGTIFKVSLDRTTEQLIPTNTRVEGSFQANATNYVGYDLRRAVDPSTADLVAFLDPDTKTEYFETVPLARTLDYKLIITPTDFSLFPSIGPIAKVVTDINNNVVSVTDCRQMFFRLATGNSAPDKYSSYAWPDGRVESLTGDVFWGGDKAINSLKASLDAIMTRAWEASGGEYWYSPVTYGNIKLIRYGTPFPSGQYFDWNSGTSTLKWKGLAYIYPNSTGNHNRIPDNTTGVVLNEHYCLYIDIDFTQDVPVATMQGPTDFRTLGSPISPGSRLIVAWRHDGAVFTRDEAYGVGLGPYAPATTTTNGVVTLNEAPVDAVQPVVASVDINVAGAGTGKVLGRGMTRGAIAGAGSIILGGGALDSFLSFASLVNTDLEFAKGADRAVWIEKEAVDVAGREVSILGGDAGDSVSVGGKDGGQVFVAGGVGGKGVAGQTSGAGGMLYLHSGSSGNLNGGNASGASGSVLLSTAGAYPAVGAVAAGAVGSLDLYGGAGGAATATGGGTASVGGSIFIVAGEGGVGAAATNGPAIGGLFRFNAGNGGDSAGVAAGGDGGTGTLYGGRGGAGYSTFAGGAGGTISINDAASGGKGGSSSTTGGSVGGVGSAVYVYGGVGGNGTGAGQPGAGGAVGIYGGAGGTGGTGMSAGGSITIQGGVAGGLSGWGGAVAVYGADALDAVTTSAAGTSGTITIGSGSGGNASAGAGGTSSAGGDLSVYSGNGGNGAATDNGPNAGGTTYFYSGYGGNSYGVTSGADGGAVEIHSGVGGNGYSTFGGGSGGVININNPIVNVGKGGDASATGGSVGGVGSIVNVYGGKGGNASGAGKPGAGGAITIAGGAAGTGGTGVANGGGITIKGGAKAGAGADGQISIGYTDTSSIIVGAASIVTTVYGNCLCSGASAGVTLTTEEGTDNSNQIKTTTTGAVIEAPGFDHLGFPAYDPIVQFRENWSRYIHLSGTHAGDGGGSDTWFFHQYGDSTLAETRTLTHPCLYQHVMASSANNCSYAYTGCESGWSGSWTKTFGSLLYTDGRAFKVEWWTYVAEIDLSGYAVVALGLVDASTDPYNSLPLAGGAWNKSIFFLSDPTTSDPSWCCGRCDTSGGSVHLDTSSPFTVAASTWYHFKIEYLHNRVNFYIDNLAGTGSMVVPINYVTTYIPSDINMRLCFGIQNQNNSAVATTLYHYPILACGGIEK